MEVLTYIVYNWTTAPPAFGDAAITCILVLYFYVAWAWRSKCCIATSKANGIDVGNQILTENIKDCPKKRSVDIRAAQGDSGQRQVETDGSYNLIVTDRKNK